MCINVPYSDNTHIKIVQLAYITVELHHIFIIAYTMSGTAPQDDISLPKATVQKIISEILPSEFSFTKDAREALIECCIEFLMILSTESNDIAEKELKKTISTDHVLKAIGDLGFSDYLPKIEQVLEEFKETNKIKEKKNNKFQNSGLSEEELLRQQEELFRASRNKLQQNNPE